MTPRKIFSRGLSVASLSCLALALSAPCRAEVPSVDDFSELQAQSKRTFRDTVTPFVKTYCVECHSNRRSKAGINFEVALKNPGDPAARKRWKQALANVKAHDMPPDDADHQPTDDERQKFVDWIGTIKFLSQKDPGPFVIRRLTKVEYGNTLHDFLGVDPSVANDLPDEVFGAGYLNSLSPLLSEQYLTIANEVLERILPAKDVPPTEIQDRLFGKAPASGIDVRAAAKHVARSLARKAYRRPPTDTELEVLLRVFDLAQGNNLSYPQSLRLVLKAILVSPQFLFITPDQDAMPSRAVTVVPLPDGKARITPVNEATILPLDDYQLASRLSYLLWATMPDVELSALADAGKLHEPKVLKAQVKRLLADPRSRALFDGFGAQWLGLGELKNQVFDEAKFPQMTAAMRAAMYDEARLYFDSIVRENRSLVSFVDSDYTFLNGTLALLYGLEKSVTGPEMRKVKLTDANRGGVLGMPGVLATTSFPNRTSAVRRGVWVLEQVLGEQVPPAPADVPALEKQDQKQVASLTLRERTELHRADATCANCHKILDPIGFGLENFDAIGRWRERDDSGGTIDAAGELPGGRRFTSPKELKAIIASRKDELARNLTEKLLAYALCRQIEGYDEIVVDRLMETVAEDGYRMQTLISEVVTSFPFVNRRVQQPVASTPHAK